MKNIENFMKLLNKIFFISTIVWMAIIFIFSHQTGAISQDFSGGITEAIVKIIFKDFESLSHSEQINILETTNYIIRKGAHFTEYAILGMFTVLTLLTYICMDKTRYAKNGTKNMLLLNSIYALLISALYAVSDEIHQGFAADRSPAILDVAIDSSGALFGILFTITLFYFYQKHIKPKGNKHRKSGTNLVPLLYVSLKSFNSNSLFFTYKLINNWCRCHSATI